MFLNELQTQFYKRGQPIQRTHRRHDPLCGSFGALTKNNHGTREALMGSWLWEKSAALRARKEQKWGSIMWLWKPLLTSFLTEGQSQPHGQAAALMSLRSWGAVLGTLAAISARINQYFPTWKWEVCCDSLLITEWLSFQPMALKKIYQRYLTPPMPACRLHYVSVNSWDGGTVMAYLLKDRV